MTDENKNTSETPITVEQIEQAENIIGLTFTADEREMMLENLHIQRNRIHEMHSLPLPNDVALPMVYNPQVPQESAHIVSDAIQISEQGTIIRPDNLEDVAFYSVTQLAELIRTQQVTSVELTEMYLNRLKCYNAVLECVVTFTDDLAFEQAKRADEEIANGQYRGVLHGIPWGAKDLFAVEGYKTTWGAMPYKDQVIDETATIVKRLEEAGAVLIAKLTLGALAYGDIWFDGKTKNPWDISEGSSGSSAGSASATSAGLVGFTIGTETYGSIVSPCTRCGVTGLRPTFGRVSRHGAMALCWSLDKIGPITRTVEDAVIVFNAIHGADTLDSHSHTAPFTWDATVDTKTLRVGYVDVGFDERALPKPDKPEDQMNEDELKEWQEYLELTQTYLTNSQAVLDVMREQGFELVPIEFPTVSYNAMQMIIGAESAAAFDELTRSNQDDLLKWQEKNSWPNTFRSARFTTAVDYINANRLRAQYMQQVAEVMQTVDVLITPFTGADAWHMTNFTGHPAVVVPNGFTSKHTPTSIIFLGNLNRDEQVLAVAKAYQDATDWHLQYPDVPLDE